MIALLRNGDYCPDGMGGFRQAWGGEEVLERVLFQLTARRGSFPLLPQVGSRLYLLGREKPAARGTVGAGYAAEALAEAALSDKKRAGGDITLVVPRAIGRCELKKLPVADLLPIIRAGLEA